MLAVLDDLVQRTVLDRTDLAFAYLPPVPADVLFDVLDEAVDRRHFWVSHAPPTVAVHVPDLMEDPWWEAFLDRIGYPRSPE